MSAIKSSNTLEKVLSQFSDVQIKLIMENVGAIQLTEGCSTGCHFCGFEAKKGVRDYTPFALIEGLVKKHSQGLGKTKPIFYLASDPFDYDFEDQGYLDVHDLVKRECGYTPFISTSVPKGKEKLIIELLQDQSGIKYGAPWCHGSTIDRISISPANYARLEKAFMENVPQLNPSAQLKTRYEKTEVRVDERRVRTNHLGNYDEIKAFIRKVTGCDSFTLDSEIFRFKIHSKPDEGIAYIMELDPLITREDFSERVFILSPDEPINFMDYIAYLEKSGEGGPGKSYAYFFVKNNVILPNEPYKLGERNKDDLGDLGIGCFHGVLITPLGAYNVQNVKPTRNHPTGQIITPISPKEFEVASLNKEIHVYPEHIPDGRSFEDYHSFAEYKTVA